MHSFPPPPLGEECTVKPVIKETLFKCERPVVGEVCVQCLLVLYASVRVMCALYILSFVLEVYRLIT